MSPPTHSSKVLQILCPVFPDIVLCPFIDIFVKVKILAQTDYFCYFVLYGAVCENQPDVQCLLGEHGSLSRGKFYRIRNLFPEFISCRADLF